MTLTLTLTLTLALVPLSIVQATAAGGIALLAVMAARFTGSPLSSSVWSPRSAASRSSVARWRAAMQLAAPPAF